MRLKTVKRQNDAEQRSSGDGVARSTTSTFTCGVVVGLFLCLQLVRNPISLKPSSFQHMDNNLIESAKAAVVTESVNTPVPTESPNTPFPASREDSRKKWMTEISGANETKCQSVFENSRKGLWEDPNHDMFQYRRIKTAPHFLVSVHHQQYDPVRYSSIYKNGNYYEGAVIQRFERILGENRDSFDFNSTPALPLVIDIGGNIGFYTLLSAAWKHAVLTFEINPANIVRICESLHLNSRNEYGFSELSHSMAVMIHRQGVSNVTGSSFRVEVHRNPGQTILENTRLQGDSGKTTERVFSTTTVTLDDFADERGWFQRTDLAVSILKIDTEGHELQIIQGAKRFLETRLVKNVLLEYRIRCREVLNILLDIGYVIVDGKPSRLLSKDESIKFINENTQKLRTATIPDHYMDLWFRLDSLPL